MGADFWTHELPSHFFLFLPVTFVWSPSDLNKVGPQPVFYFTETPLYCHSIWESLKAWFDTVSVVPFEWNQNQTASWSQSTHSYQFDSLIG